MAETLGPDVFNHVYELAYYCNTWEFIDVTAEAGGWNAESRNALTSNFYNSNHVYYIGQNNYVCELVQDKTWHFKDFVDEMNR